MTEHDHLIVTVPLGRSRGPLWPLEAACNVPEQAPERASEATLTAPTATETGVTR
jgi:hypothetical protein